MAIKKKPAKKTRKTTRLDVLKAGKATAAKLLALRMELADAKVAEAKQAVAPALRVMPALNIKPQSHPGFNVIAKMIETCEGGYAPSTYLARVPVMMTTIPEVPEVITLEGKFFILTTTFPMTYTQKLFAEAKRV